MTKTAVPSWDGRFFLWHGEKIVMSISGITPAEDAVQADGRCRGHEISTARIAPGESKRMEKLAEKFTELNQTSFQIMKHPASEMIIVRVVDQNTGQVIREAPCEAVLNCVSHLLA